MDLQRLAVDIHQFRYGRTSNRGRPTVTILPYSIINRDVNLFVGHYIRGRSSVSVWTYNMTSVDVHQFLYGRTTFGRGRPPVTICNITSMDVDQFLYRRTTYGRGRPPVTIWSYNITSVDVHQFLYGCTMSGRGRPPVSLWTYNVWPRTSTNYYLDIQRAAEDIHQDQYGCTTLDAWTFISLSVDKRHDIRGRPPLSSWTYNVWPWMTTSSDMDVQNGVSSVSLWTFMYNITSVDVHQVLYEPKIVVINGHKSVSLWT